MRLILPSLLLAACAAAPEASADRCAPPTGWEAVADAAEGGFLVVGEMHGTNEVPAAFAQYVCAVSARDGRTLVGLEIGEAYAEALAAATTSDAPEALLRDAMDEVWRSTDGRGSEAMLAMMVDIAAMGGVDMLAFSRFADLEALGMPMDASQEEKLAWLQSLPLHVTQQGREEAMAAVLNEAAPGYDRVIVLVGNIHAGKTRFDFLEGADNMAMLLDGKVVALDNRFDGGEAWNAQGGSGKANEAGTWLDGVPEGADAPMMRLTAEVGPRYDGVLYVGSITASPPAAGVPLTE